MSEKDKAIQLEKKIVSVWNEIDRDCYEIARMAKEFIDRQYYVELGYKTPDDWARKVLGYGKRKIQFLVSIEKKLIECGVPENKRAEIGWTKARLISRVMTKETAEELIEKAKKMTVIEIEDEVNRNEAADKKSQNKPIGYIRIPYYDEDQEVTFNETLELAAKMTASNRKEIGFMAMCQEFLGTYSCYTEMISDPIKKAILERDNYTCRFPECGERDNIQIHEIIFKSHGGKMSEENSICLCAEHHRKVTDSEIKIERIADNQYKFIKK